MKKPTVQGSLTWTNVSNDQWLSCGCKLYADGVVTQCPLHEAAPDLLEAVKLALDVFYERKTYPKPAERRQAADNLRQAITKAEGR